MEAVAVALRQTRAALSRVLRSAARTHAHADRGERGKVGTDLGLELLERVTQSRTPGRRGRENHERALALHDAGYGGREVCRQMTTQPAAPEACARGLICDARQSRRAA